MLIIPTLNRLEAAQNSKEKKIQNVIGMVTYQQGCFEQI